jgi:hypothetical protein
MYILKTDGLIIQVNDLLVTMTSTNGISPLVREGTLYQLIRNSLRVIKMWP